MKSYVDKMILIAATMALISLPLCYTFEVGLFQKGEVEMADNGLTVDRGSSSDLIYFVDDTGTMGDHDNSQVYMLTCNPAYGYSIEVAMEEGEKLVTCDQSLFSNTMTNEYLSEEDQVVSAHYIRGVTTEGRQMEYWIVVDK